jgi:hypothetical protein
MKAKNLIFLTVFILAVISQLTNVQAAEIDEFKILVAEAAQSVAGLKRCTDEMHQAINSMANDSAFATSVFKAVTSGNTSQVQSLYAQKAPSCTVQVSNLEKDFAFRLTFGNPQTGNNFFLCAVSRNHPTKCPDGTRFDLNIVIR